MTTTISLFRKTAYGFQLTLKMLLNIFVLRYRRVKNRGDHGVDLYQNLSPLEREIAIANLQIITNSLKRF